MCFANESEHGTQQFVCSKSKLPFADSPSNVEGKFQSITGKLSTSGSKIAVCRYIYHSYRGAVPNVNVPYENERTKLARCLTRIPMVLSP